MFYKRRLKRMFVAEPFDGGDPSAVNLSERHETRIDGQAVDQDCARAALALTTPFFGAGEAALVPQHIEKPRHGMHAQVRALAVQRETHAAMIFSGVAGISRTSMPACRIALTTAGAGPSIGISPTPFAPNGPRAYGFSSTTTSSFGVSSVVGMM